MTPLNFALVGLRLLAVYCFIHAVTPVFSALAMAATLSDTGGFRPSPYPVMLYNLLPGVALLLLGGLLLLFSGPLAHRLVPSANTGVQMAACTFDQMQALAFAAAGLLILADAFPGLVRAVENLVEVAALNKQGGAMPADQVIHNGLYCCGVVLQMSIGLLLLLNPKGFRNVWRWLRTAGT
jgi:hypothetical protein